MADLLYFVDLNHSLLGEKVKKKKERYCKNCHYPVPFYGRHCSNCGQRYRDNIVTLGQLLGEFVDTVFNLDNRLFRTIVALMIPAKLGLEYFAGRQKRYIQPLRLFFVLSILHLASLSFFALQDLEDEISDSIYQQTKRGHYVEFMEKIGEERDTLLMEFDHVPELKTATDSLIERISDKESFYFGGGYFTKTDNGLEVITFEMDVKDVYNLEREELFKKYEIPEGWWPRFQVNQFLKIFQKGDSFARQMAGQLIWMYILLLPALALVMKLLYIRRKKYFVEHLIFNFHFHAFVFFWGGIVWMLASIDDNNVEVYVPLLFVVGLIYLFVAMKRYYKQGFFKTFIKFYLYNSIYVALWVFFFVLTLAASALTF